MLKKRTYKSVVWLNVQNPTTRNVRDLIRTYGIEPVTGEEILTSTTQPTVRIKKDYIHVTLLFPVPREDDQGETTEEVDFIIGKKFLITAYTGHSDPIYDFTKKIEAETLTQRKRIATTPARMWFLLLQTFYTRHIDVLDEISATLERIEQQIFEGGEQRMIPILAETNRHLLRLKRTLGLHIPLYETLAQDGSKFFGKKFLPYLEALKTTSMNLHAHILHNKEILEDLKQTSELLISHRTNNLARVFAIFAFITIPVTMVMEITALELMPITPTLILGMLAIAFSISGLIFLFARYKRFI